MHYFCFSECVWLFFFFKQKTAYEMRISDWSSDVCSSDLLEREALALRKCRPAVEEQRRDAHDRHLNHQRFALLAVGIVAGGSLDAVDPGVGECRGVQLRCFLCVMIVPEAHLVLGGHLSVSSLRSPVVQRFPGPTRPKAAPSGSRSEEHTSELQSLMP